MTEREEIKNLNISILASVKDRLLEIQRDMRAGTLPLCVQRLILEYKLESERGVVELKE